MLWSDARDISDPVGIKIAEPHDDDSEEEGGGAIKVKVCRPRRKLTTAVSGFRRVTCRDTRVDVKKTILLL